MSSNNTFKIALAIESSCDETSLALLQIPLNKDSLNDFDYLNKVKILASVISSQIEIHEKYGGVVPEIGARMHAEQIHFLWTELINQLDTALKNDALVNIDEIFVTTHPGLKSALRVGHEFAKSLAFFAEVEIFKKTAQNKQIPIFEINHLKGHLASCFFQSANI